MQVVSAETIWTSSGVMNSLYVIANGVVFSEGFFMSSESFSQADITTIAMAIMNENFKNFSFIKAVACFVTLVIYNRKIDGSGVFACTTPEVFTGFYYSP